MKKISIRQYIATLIVCFLAIAILSFCTIQAFYKKSVNDTLSLGESALKQQKEQMDAYLSRGMDAVEVTAINIEYMLSRFQIIMIIFGMERDRLLCTRDFWQNFLRIIHLKRC